jgi:hypothetical protein
MSSSFADISPVAPLWFILILTSILSVFFVWGELRCKSRLLSWRIGAQGVVLMALLGLVLQPSFNFEKSEGPVLLLTKGYSKKTADSLLMAYPYLHVLRTSTAEDFRSSEVLPSYTDLSAAGNAIRFIIGEGLPGHALTLIQEKNFSYCPSPLPKGITGLYFEIFYPNRRNTLRGKFNTGGLRTVLRLIGPSGIEDSVVLNSKGSAPFSLSFIPRQSGQFIYSLSYTDSAGSHSEKIPIEIRSEKKLHISFLQQYPTFETRYLKNYLSERGHALMGRYQVSKNLYRDEFINGEHGKTAHATQDFFHWSDLLFIDQGTLSGLSATERHSLEDAIHSGLGILILFDKSPGVKYLSYYFTFPFNKTAPDTALIDPGTGKISLPSLPVLAEPKAGIEPIIATREGRVISGYQNLDFGKAGFQFLQETYSLVLKGQSDAYAAIWSPVVERLARQKMDPFKIKISTPFPYYVNDPISIEIISADKRPTLLADSIRVPLIEDVTIDNLWHGKIWTGRTGWHSLLIPEDSTRANFYVSGDMEWSSLSLAHQLNLNRIEGNSAVSLSAKKETARRNVPPILFFLLFVLGSGFLWLAPKI